MPRPQSDPIAEGWLNLQKGRAFIKQRFPYFYRVVLGFIPRHVPDIGTMYVTPHMVLGVDFNWYRTLEVEVAAGCIMHEVMHVLRDISRISALPDFDVATYAFDMPINDDLRNMGAKLPPWAVYSNTHGFPPGLSGEGYYHLLKKNHTQLPTKLQFGAGSCGSCDGHSKDPGKPPPGEPTDTEIGRSSNEVSYFKKIGAADIREHIKRSGMQAGDIPGTWSELLEFEDEKPVIPWQSIMPARLGESFGRITFGNTDYSLRRPSKRSFAYGWVRPGRIGYEPNVVVIEDSSGSMSHVQLKENRVELAFAMISLGIRDVWFLDADIEVQTKPKKITVQQLFTIPVKGRGGTDFRPAVDLVLKLNPRPDLIIYSTDGIGRAHDRKPPNTEFIWLLAPGTWTRSPCNWGIQILTSNDPEERKRYELLAA